MSFSFRKLFKKSEQDSGGERTRLRFGRPLDQDLSSNESNSSTTDPEGLTAEGVFATPSSLSAQGLPSREFEGSAEVQSPFQIAEPVAGKPKILGSPPAQPFQLAETVSSSASEVSGAGDELVKKETSGLFDAVPKPAVEPASAGFYESVMKNGADEDPDPFFSRECSPDGSSVLEDNPSPEQRSSLASSGPADVEPVAGPHQPPWVDDPEQNRSGASPLRTAFSDTAAETHEQLTQNPADKIEAERNACPEKAASFPTTGPMPGALETEDIELNRPFEGGGSPAPEQPYSSRIPDAPELLSEFPHPSADAELPEEIGTSGHFPAFFENQDSAEDEDLANGQDFPAFPDTTDKGDITSDWQPGEGQRQSAGSNRELPGFPDFSSNDKQGVGEKPSPDHIDPEPPPVPTEQPSSLGSEEALTGAGPWPLGGELSLPKVPLMQPEPLESLSPLAGDSPGVQGSLASEGEPALGQTEPQSANVSHTSSTIGQSTLRALLLTDAEIDEEMVVRHCADLEGVHLCVASTTDGRVKVSSVPSGAFEIDVMGLLGSVRVLTEAFGAGLEGSLTLRSPEGLVSFFISSNACLGVLHAEGALESGVQEHLWLIAGALNAECK